MTQKYIRDHPPQPPIESNWPRIEWRDREGPQDDWGSWCLLDEEEDYEDITIMGYLLSDSVVIVTLTEASGAEWQYRIAHMDADRCEDCGALLSSEAP
jgi:hypothetical protein